MHWYTSKLFWPTRFLSTCFLQHKPFDSFICDEICAQDVVQPYPTITVPKSMSQMHTNQSPFCHNWRISMNSPFGIPKIYHTMAFLLYSIWMKHAVRIWVFALVQRDAIPIIMFVLMLSYSLHLGPLFRL